MRDACSSWHHPRYDIAADLALAGAPDVIFVDSVLRHVCVAIGDPGLIEVFDIDRFERVDQVVTEPGAHTIGIHAERHRIYALMPLTHRAAVFRDAA